MPRAGCGAISLYYEGKLIGRRGEAERVLLSVEMGGGRVMASDCKKEGKRGEKIELQYVFQSH